MGSKCQLVVKQVCQLLFVLIFCIYNFPMAVVGQSENSSVDVGDFGIEKR